jgi:dTDP-4-amino-4,6-dideoxygalactose transaminase
MDWKVRYVDYPRQFKDHEHDYMGIIRDVLTKGDLMLREQLVSFEENLAKFCGTNHAVGMSNCTDAIFLALHAAGVGPGDEVITV